MNDIARFYNMKVLFGLFLTFFTSVYAVSVPRWCVTSSASLAQCQKVQTALNGTLTCVQGSDEKDCYKKINMKQADFGVFDGGMILLAGKEHDLRAIMAEKLKSGAGQAVAYYAVAVVKANSAITLSKLKGKSSCHTGVGKTAGWNIPVGTLLRKSYMSCVNDNVYASVANFFNASCAPGANNIKYNPKKYGEKKLCSLCTGSGSNKCVRNSSEPYYNYGGAFKCLQDGAGDVAFVKQSTILALPAADQQKYKLLCLDDKTAAPNQFPSCNLAKAPAHAVLARPDAPLAAYQKVLGDADKYLGTGKNSSVKLYENGLLFSKNAVGLEVVAPAKQSYKSYLDTAYLEDFSSIEKCNKVKGKAGGLTYSFKVVLSVLFFYWLVV